MKWLLISFKIGILAFVQPTAWFSPMTKINESINKNVTFVQYCYCMIFSPYKKSSIY